MGETTAAFLLALAVGSAPSAPVRMALLTSVAGEPVPAAASVEAALMKALTLRPGLHPVRAEELFVLGGNVERRIADCGSDEACTAEVLRSLDIEYGLLVLVSTDSADCLLDMRLVRSDDARRLDQASNLVSSTDRGIREALMSEASVLLDRAGFVQVGRLDVVATPHHATIEIIRGTEVRAGSTHDLPAGEYLVRGRAEGHTASDVRVTVTAGKHLRVNLDLEPKDPPVYQRAWFWGAVGAVVVGAAVAGAVVASRSELPCFCVNGDGSPCMTCP